MTTLAIAAFLLFWTGALVDAVRLGRRRYEHARRSDELIAELALALERRRQRGDGRLTSAARIV